ncbi:MAG: LysR family transcriptional regulator [Pigmentiphaga sp.]|nr:LysR family transcriptional regulator [Pigmentiphaga sp.]
MANIDLHALRLLDEIYKTGSFSRAADRLGLTQPAVSLALAKLRAHFNDAMFVRVGNVMRPTPQMEGLIENVRLAIKQLESTLSYRLEFDPLTTERTFKVAMTDIGQIIILPRLLNALRVRAPRARLEFINITERIAQQLESGEVDLAIGFVAQLSDVFYQQTLFEERFVCLARTGHPRIRDALTLEDFESESHVFVQTSGTGHLLVDRTIETLGIKRRIAVRIPNFLGLATVIGSTDLLCTVPKRAGVAMAQMGAVTAWPVPFKLPSYAVRQHWHERQARDPGNRWLRELHLEIFGEDRAPE